MHLKMDEILKSRVESGIKNNEIRHLNAEYLFYYLHALLFPYITILIKNNKLNASEIHQHSDFIIDLLLRGVLE